MQTPGQTHGCCPDTVTDHVRYDAKKLRPPSCSMWCCWEMLAGTSRQVAIPLEIMTHMRYIARRFALNEDQKMRPVSYLHG